MSQPNAVTSTLNPKPRKKRRSRAQISQDANADDTRKQFVAADYALICDWLEVPENLDAITGTKGKTKVAARFRTKKQAFEALAAFINDRQLKGSRLATIDGDGARNRFTLLERKYKSAKPIIEVTGFGLTEEDLANHIDTIEAKVESLCPCYYRLDGLFGSDPNVNFAENNYNSTVPGVEADHMPWSEGFEAFQNPDPEEIRADVDLESSRPDVVNVSGSTDPVGSTEMEMPIPHVEGNVVDETHVGDTPVHDGAPNSTQSGVEGNPQPNGAPNSTQSGVEGRAGSASSSQKKQKTTKKLDKGASINSAFAAGLESISLTKVQGNVLKERGQDLVFKALEADRQVRSESAQKQLDFQVDSTQKQLMFQIQTADRQFQVEVEKLKVVEKRILADELKIAADSRRDLMQAQVAILNSNQNLTAAEIANLFRMLANPDGTSSNGV